MMNNYEIRIIPKVDATGKTYWTAFYPAIDGCVGGGDTAEEAIKDAAENLEIFLIYLKEEKRELPNPYCESQYNGKIALRLPKRTHELVAMKAKEEEVSINTFLISAVENYLGKKEYEFQLEEKIEQLRDIASKSLYLQGLNYELNKTFTQGWVNTKKKMILGGGDE